MASGNDRKAQGSSSGRQSDNFGRVAPMCPKFRKNHWDDWVVQACFKYGATRYFKKYFPQVKKEEQGSHLGFPHACVFTMSKVDAEVSLLVVVERCCQLENLVVP